MAAITINAQKDEDTAVVPDLIIEPEIVLGQIQHILFNILHPNTVVPLEDQIVHIVRLLTSAGSGICLLVTG